MLHAERVGLAVANVVDVFEEKGVEGTVVAVYIQGILGLLCVGSKQRGGGEECNKHAPAEGKGGLHRLAILKLTVPVFTVYPPAGSDERLRR